VQTHADARGISDLLAVESSRRDTQWLQKSLQSAVDLEFATLPVYLSGMWSIEDQSGLVHDLIRSVVLEEMLHMGLACNMLRALKVHPAINAPRYPGGLPGGVRPGLEVYLAGLSPDTVRMYMDIEEPEQAPSPTAQTYPTIGAFYDAIWEAFQQLSPSLSADGQLTATFSFTVPDPPRPDKTINEALQPVTSLADVKQAIDTIKDQGEGTSTSPDAPEFGGDLAHFYRFGEILYGKRYVPVDGTWGYVGDPVEFPACFPVTRVPPGGYPELAAMQPFDQMYGQLIANLGSAWGDGGHDALEAAIGIMFKLYDVAQPIIAAPLPVGVGNYGPDFIPRP
jgi:hypothetical protein